MTCRIASFLPLPDPNSLTNERTAVASVRFALGIGASLAVASSLVSVLAFPKKTDEVAPALPERLARDVVSPLLTRQHPVNNGGDDNHD
jgi:hypothetical protein